MQLVFKTRGCLDDPQERLVASPATVDQVAERLNVSVAYVRRRLIFEQRIEYEKICRHVRIDEAELEAFIDAGRVSRPRLPPHPTRSDFGGRAKSTRRRTRG